MSLLKAAGDFYMAFGAMLGGQQLQQQTSQACHKHDHKRDLDQRLSNLERGVNFNQWQPTNSVTVVNNNNNTLISR